jgi:hypothetical protein
VWATERSQIVHPTLMQEIARYRQADLFKEAERARLAHEASVTADRPRRRFRLRRRERPAYKPAFER